MSSNRLLTLKFQRVKSQVYGGFEFTNHLYVNPLKDDISSFSVLLCGYI